MIATHSSASGYYSLEQRRFLVNVPESVADQPERVSLDLGSTPVVGDVRCGPGEGVDTHRAAIDGLALPPEWLDLSFRGCGPGVDPGGTMSATIVVQEAILNDVASRSVRALYDITIVGAGPRAGHTLRVHGSVRLTRWGSGP